MTDPMNLTRNEFFAVVRKVLNGEIEHYEINDRWSFHEDHDLDDFGIDFTLHFWDEENALRTGTFPADGWWFYRWIVMGCPKPKIMETAKECVLRNI